MTKMTRRSYKEAGATIVESRQARLTEQRDYRRAHASN
jgi:hypothetical protein